MPPQCCLCVFCGSIVYVNKGSSSSFSSPQDHRCLPPAGWPTPQDTGTMCCSPAQSRLSKQTAPCLCCLHILHLPERCCLNKLVYRSCGGDRQTFQRGNNSVSLPNGWWCLEIQQSPRSCEEWRQINNTEWSGWHRHPDTEDIIKQSFTSRMKAYPSYSDNRWRLGELSYENVTLERIWQWVRWIVCWAFSLCSDSAAKSANAIHRCTYKSKVKGPIWHLCDWSPLISVWRPWESLE